MSQKSHHCISDEIASAVLVTNLANSRLTPSMAMVKMEPVRLMAAIV